MDGVYYLIGSDSPVMQVVRKHLALLKEFRQAIEALRVKHGAAAVFTHGNRSFAGLKFAGEAPRGWRRREDDLCVPDARLKAGREAKQDVEALPRGYDEWNFAGDLGENYLFFGSGHVYFSTFGQYGDKFVLRVPAACQVKPEGCTDLKMSEYWKIREDAGVSAEPEQAAA